MRIVATSGSGCSRTSTRDCLRNVSVAWQWQRIEDWISVLFQAYSIFLNNNCTTTWTSIILQKVHIKTFFLVPLNSLRYICSSYFVLRSMQSIQNLGLAVINQAAGIIVDAKGYLFLEVFFCAWLCRKYTILRHCNLATSFSVFSWRPWLIHWCHFPVWIISRLWGYHEKYVLNKVYP
jgi:hypothetical protein